MNLLPQGLVPKKQRCRERLPEFDGEKAQSEAGDARADQSEVGESQRKGTNRDGTRVNGSGKIERAQSSDGDCRRCLSPDTVKLTPKLLV